MAIQAQLYQENLGFPLFGSQDYIDNNNTCGYNIQNQFLDGVQQKLQFQQQQEQQQQQQQQHLYMQQLQNLQQKNQIGFLNNKGCGDYKNDVLASILEGTNHQINQQGQEIDQFLMQQNERLRWALEEQRKQQLVSLLKKLEAKAQILLRQKDQEIAKATNTAIELQNFVTKLEAERQTWQRLAQENAAMVTTLLNTIQQLKNQAYSNANIRSNNEEEDAESCCDNIRGREGGSGENKGCLLTTICKSCNSRPSCMLYLPCRHLCSCKECEMFLECCPMCSALKKDSIEVLLS